MRVPGTVGSGHGAVVQPEVWTASLRPLGAPPSRQRVADEGEWISFRHLLFIGCFIHCFVLKTSSVEV